MISSACVIKQAKGDEMFITKFQNRNKEILNYNQFRQVSLQRGMQSTENLEQIKQEVRDAINARDNETVRDKIKELRTAARNQAQSGTSVDKEARDMLRAYYRDGINGLDLFLQLTDGAKLDLNEKTTLNLASTIGLTDEVTREKLFKEAINGTLSPFQKRQIEQVQIGLQKDKKYSGEIDGKFGELSTYGLKEMLLENRSVLDESIALFKGFEIKDLLAESARETFSKVISNNKISSNEADDLAWSLSSALDNPDISNIPEIREVISELWNLSTHLEYKEIEDSGFNISYGREKFIGSKEVDLSELENLTPKLQNLIKSDALTNERY